MTTRMTKVVMMTMSYSDLLAKSGSVLMRSVAFGDYHNEMTKVKARMMTMVRTRTKTKIVTMTMSYSEDDASSLMTTRMTKVVMMTMSYSEFPARPGSQVARLDFDIGAGLVGGQRF